MTDVLFAELWTSYLQCFIISNGLSYSGASCTCIFYVVCGKIKKKITENENGLRSDMNHIQLFMRVTIIL